MSAAMRRTSSFQGGPCCQREGDVVCDADATDVTTPVSDLAHLESLLHESESMVKKCRSLGMMSNYNGLVQQSRKVLDSLITVDEYLSDNGLGVDEPAMSNNVTRRDQLERSVQGFMGYGLMKQGKYEEALPFLERSIQLREKLVGVTGPRNHREAIATEQAYKHCQEQTSGVSVKSSTPALIKYPRTAHLFDAGGTATSADDLVLSENSSILAAFCSGTTRVVIEEKIDGANLGISFDPSKNDFLVQNRSHYISSGEHAQFSRITEWIEQHRQGLTQVLCQEDNLQDGGLILYGEWLAACHSIPYHRLPGLFVAYDILDKKQGRFFSRKRFHTSMRDSGIPIVPAIETRTFGPYARQKQGANLFRSDLIAFLETKSAFRNDNGTVEGVVLRVDDADSSWLEHRYKIVRTDFVRGCMGAHWTRRSIEKQQVDFAFALEYITQCYPFAEAETKEEASNEAKAEKGQPKTEAVTPSAKVKVAREEKEYAAQRARARRRAPRIVMTMGLPGSGKSTFANRLAASAPDEWKVVNQDQMGKKKCIVLAGKASRKNRVIVDRCHPTLSDRQEWHDILGSPSKAEVALVYFAADVDTCIKRAQSRANHETIPEGKGEKIVKCVAKVLEPPSREDEQLFGTIEILNTFEESDALLHKWGVDIDCNET